MISETRTPTPEEAGRIHNIESAHEAALEVERARRYVEAAQELLSEFGQAAEFTNRYYAAESGEIEYDNKSMVVAQNPGAAVEILGEKALGDRNPDNLTPQEIQELHDMNEARRKLIDEISFAAIGERGSWANITLQQALDFLPGALSSALQESSTIVDILERPEGEDPDYYIGQTDEGQVGRTTERLGEVVGNGVVSRLVGKK